MRALVGITGIVAAITLSGAAHAGPVEPLKPSEMVNLFPTLAPTPVACTSCGASCVAFDKQVVREANGNGLHSGKFAGNTNIPIGQVLIVTGVEWTGGGDDIAIVVQFGSSPGQFTELARYPNLSPAGAGGGVVQGSSLFNIPTLPEGSRICISPKAGVTAAHLHGYLTADR